MKELKDYNHPAAIADVCSQLGVDPRVGLARDDAIARRSLYGANRVTPPINCPSWICCLLPCLLRTASMQAFHATLPRDAVVRRQATNAHGGPAASSSTSEMTQTLRMDATSLVVGDIIELVAGDLVSADVRVVECSRDCVVDQSTLASDSDSDADLERGNRSTSLIRKVVAVSNPQAAFAAPLEAPNVLLMASRVVKGTAVGVVVATGDRTFWGQLLAQHAWPVPSTTKRAGWIDKYSPSGAGGGGGGGNNSSNNPEEHRLMATDDNDLMSPRGHSRSSSSSSASTATAASLASTTTATKTKNKNKKTKSKSNGRDFVV